MTQDLAALFNLHGSDKDTNGYSSLYSALFWRMKSWPIKLLEIGVGTMVPGAPSSMQGYMPDSYSPGASLRAWRDWFEQAEIHGMDIQQDCVILEDKIVTHICNTTNPAECQAWREAHPTLFFDVIIDDGSHWELDQLATLRSLFPVLKMGGYYVIEDVPIGSLIAREPHRITEIVGDFPVFFAGLKNNLVVIQKVPLKYTKIF
jgi:demethylmacrocin O-methyltransferase